jgi:glycosyltransferase involved in cell wall biosynthesis
VRAPRRRRLLRLAASLRGFGLTILEAMRLGKAVIATAYSGNMDVMTEDNSSRWPTS